jgi:nicotinate-nucleotide adenylyltransferase
MSNDAIGILGGTFDPVHLGHLRSALEVAEILSLNHVRIIPNGQPPHREQPNVSVQHRVLMLHLAIKNSDKFIVDDREVNREGPSYMVDTLTSLRVEFPENPLYLIVGSDAFNSIDTWHQWHKLIELAHIVVVTRPDEQLTLSTALTSWYQQHKANKADATLPCGKVWPTVVTQLAISSSDIRHRIKNNESAQFLVPDGVLQVIEQAGLYKA